MPSRYFVYEGKKSEVIPTGIGTGVATGFEPSVNQWSMIFRPVSELEAAVKGYITSSDPMALSEEELGRA